MLASCSLFQALRWLAPVVLVVLSQPSQAQSCCAPAGTDVVAWWSLDETAGSVAAEHAGLHLGTHSGGPTPAAGQVQGALSFDGFDDYVSVADSDAWTFPGDFTIELWAWWDVVVGSSNDTDTFVSHDTPGGNGQSKWIFFTTSGAQFASNPNCVSGDCLMFHINYNNSPNNGNGHWIGAPFEPVVARWYHIAVVRENGTYVFYVDGVEVGREDNAAQIQPAGIPLTIGQAEGGNFMNGRLDELAIYHRALCPAELETIVAAGPMGKCDLLDCNANGVEDEYDVCTGSSPDGNANQVPDECEVTSYCTAGLSTSGCTATMATSGIPSATAPSGFVITATNVEGAKDGMFFFGVNGQQAAPWGTGFQCVMPPAKRCVLQPGVGTANACDGLFSQDLNALWCPICTKPQHNPGAGATVQAQFWYRDPWNTATNKGTTMSDAIEFVVGP